MIPSEGLYDTVYNWDVKIRDGRRREDDVQARRRLDEVHRHRGLGADLRGDGATASTPSPSRFLTTKITPNDMRLVNSRNHYQNFVDAVEIARRRSATWPTPCAATSSAICANIAVRLKRKITWDPAKRAIVGDEEAAKLTRRAYRAPWTL